MSVHYKFKSALDYDTLAFDGLHITVGEVKTAISQQKRIGKSSDFDLQITNAQTKEVYTDDGALIPKNTSLLVARVPLAQQPKKQWPGEASAPKRRDGGPHAPGPADLSRMEGSEQDKISAMISQSTLDYDPSNYQKIRGQNQRGEVPAHYRCNRCQRPGHWIKNCPTANIPGAESVDIRRSTGIPQSFMVPVDGPKAPGAMMTPRGSFAVPAVDHEAYQASETVGGEPAPESERREIPDDLICSLCRDLLTDAVMIPCCGNSFCDECIRGTLLESEDHECPDCREKEIAPTTLIPNRFLRNSVASFRNQTGYSRRAPHRAAVVAAPPPQPAAEPPPSNVPQRPPNGQTQAGQPIAVSTGVGAGAGGAAAAGAADESDGSGEDNITVTVPPPSGGGGYPPHQRARRPYAERPYGERPRGPRDDRPRDERPRDDRPPGGAHAERYGAPPGLQPPHRDRPPGPHLGMGRVLEEQRAGTPTVDERRDAINPQMMYNRPPMYMHAAPMPHYPMGYDGPPGAPPFIREPFQPEPFQPPPPGIKESPTLRRGEDPLEAFNRMIREKEERAKRRETERRRLHSPPSRSPPPRSPPARSPPARSPPPRSPPPRSPPPRSPPPRLRTRTRSPPGRVRSPPPRVRSPPSRASSRIRYSRSRSGSRGRRRSPAWSPRRRPPPPRERTLSLTRSPSPGRRRRSPLLRYRSPLRSPLRSPPPRSPPPRRSPPPPAHRSPPHPHPHHRYGGGYEDRASPPRRSVEPPHAVRYGSRTNGPPSFPPNVKSIPTLGEPPTMKEPSPAFRARYEEPPFEEIPPGAEPPVPGYEPPPFDNPALAQQPFHRPPYVDAPPPYRDMPPLQRDGFRGPPQPDGFRGPPQPDGFRGPPQPDGFRGPPQPDGFRGPPQPDGFRGPPQPDGFRGPPQPYRDGLPYRDRMPPQQFRDPNPSIGYRGGPPPGFGDAMPPQGYRGNAVPPYRDAGPPPGYRDPAPQMFRDGPPASFRPQNVRDPLPGPMMYQEPNMRDGFREIPPLMPEPNGGRDQIRGGYRHGSRNVRGGPRRNFDSDRQRERPDREGRHGDRDNSDKTERKNNYERARDERSRDFDRNRDVADKEREREIERSSPERKRKSSAERTPPRRSRVVDARDKRKSESRGRSKERESKRDRKDERDRDRSAETKAKDQKEKNRKEKERKKKKKEKEAEKKKKRDKKERKDKDAPKVEDDHVDTEKNVLPSIKEEPGIHEELEKRTENPEKPLENLNNDNDLYGGIGTDVAVDKEIMQTYVKIEPEEHIKKEIVEEPARVEKDSSFEGLELSAAGQDLESKPEEKDKEMLAPVPELSKWEMDDEQNDKFGREPGEISPETDTTGKVTSEVIKRAENAIFAKAINSIKTIEIKKISNDRLKLYSDESGEHKDTPMNNIQITVPVTNVEQRSIELTNDRKLKRSKTPVQQKLSVKDRLGGKIEDPNRNREDRFVHSTIERIKSKSKTPKRDHPYRRVTVDTRDRPRRMVGNVEDVQNPHRYARQEDRRIPSETVPRSDYRRPDKPADSRIDHSSIKDKAKKKDHKSKKSKEDKHPKEGKHTEGKVEEMPKDEKEKEALRPERDRKRSTLDESNFEPDYDEHVESDEGKEEGNKKRERSATPAEREQSEAKKAKTDMGSIAKKQETGTDTSSDSDSSSSSSSSEVRKKKRKKKKSKRKKKKVASDSESESDGSSSDEPKKKKKKSKHKKKSSKKKKKKSKHK